MVKKEKVNQQTEIGKEMRAREKMMTATISTDICHYAETKTVRLKLSKILTTLTLEWSLQVQ